MNKKAEDLNIIIVSMEKCGSSWPAAIITEVYYKMTGKWKEWNHEISRVLATDPNFELPTGWLSVCNVEPQLVLDRGFDRVIVLERNLEIVKRVFWMYYEPTIPFEQGLKREPKFFKRIEEQYKRVYGKRIEDPRLFWVSLEDLNNYTVKAFTELFDFLNIKTDRRFTDTELLAITLYSWYSEFKPDPTLATKDIIKEQFRYIAKKFKEEITIKPQLIPVNPPERNWQTYSDIYPRGYEVNDRLKQIQYLYALNKTESQIQLEQMKKKDLSSIRNVEKGLRYDYAEDPYKRRLYLETQEAIIQNNKKFRVNLHVNIPDALKSKKVLLLGSKGYGVKAHFSENLYDVMRNHHYVKYYSEQEFAKMYDTKEWNDFRIKKKPIKLSTLIDLPFGKPNFIFIGEMDVHFDNDTDIPVFYFHKYLHRALCIRNPDAIFFIHEDYLKYYEKYVDAYAISKIPIKGVMYPAVNPELYKPTKKTVSNVSGIGFRKKFADWKRAEEIVKDDQIDLMEKGVQEFKKAGFRYFDSPLTDKQYRETLPTLDAFWIAFPSYQYVSNRMFDAMACRTLCVIQLQNDRHKEILEKIGFVEGIHYLGVRQISEIKERYAKFNRIPVVYEARKNVLENHTFKNRMDQIIDLYDTYFTHRFEIIDKDILDLGCGLNKTEGAFGVDIVELEGVDLVHDLNKIPYPFEPNSFQGIILSDVLEHLDEPVKIIKECHRLLKDGGKLMIKVVYFSHPYAWGDPQHKHAFSEVYFTHFVKSHTRSYCYDFHFKEHSLTFITNGTQRQAMEVVLTK